MQSSFEKLGGTYRQESDYLLPNVKVPKNPATGIWGQRRHKYLVEHNHAFYTALFLNGKLTTHLEEIDRLATKMYDRLVEQLKQRDSITEELKALIPIDGMYELVEELKNKGYGIYLLSNASVRQHEYWPRIAASRFFDSTLISADEHAVKPQPEIYRLCLERFHLKAEKCFFIDDMAHNIEGALWCGLSGVVFHGDIYNLRKDLRVTGVNVEERV